MRNSGFHIPEDKVSAFCREHHVHKLALFGSVLREDFNSVSDIDVLVEFKLGQTPGFFGLARMERELSQVFRGRKVDIRTPEDLSEYFRDQVVATAQVQFEDG